MADGPDRGGVADGPDRGSVTDGPDRGGVADGPDRGSAVQVYPCLEHVSEFVVVMNGTVSPQIAVNGCLHTGVREKPCLNRTSQTRSICRIGTSIVRPHPRAIYIHWRTIGGISRVSPPRPPCGCMVFSDRNGLMLRGTQRSIAPRMSSDVIEVLCRLTRTLPGRGGDIGSSHWSSHTTGESCLV